MRQRFVVMGLALVLLSTVGLCAAYAACGSCGDAAAAPKKPAARACGCGAQHAAGKGCGKGKHAATNSCARATVRAACTNAASCRAN